MRNTFAAGRVDRKTSELVLRIRREAPFPGPWSLTAVTGSAASGEHREPVRVIPFPGIDED